MLSKKDTIITTDLPCQSAFAAIIKKYCHSTILFLDRDEDINNVPLADLEKVYLIGDIHYKRFCNALGKENTKLMPVACEDENELKKYIGDERAKAVCKRHPKLLPLIYQHHHASSKESNNFIMGVNALDRNSIFSAFCAFLEDPEETVEGRTKIGESQVAPVIDQIWEEICGDKSDACVTFNAIKGIKVTNPFPVAFNSAFIVKAGHVFMHKKFPEAPFTLIILSKWTEKKRTVRRVSLFVWDMENYKGKLMDILGVLCVPEEFGGGAQSGGGLLKQEWNDLLS